ncbi:hypothetical protein Scep_025829 [Stephania cephalantha]|uniref:Uncharacterized protein n=1 Tax=Stephania cephalantha TaxID=152367 RepID=A0AAP0EIX8_9MAGN
MGINKIKGRTQMQPESSRDEMGEEQSCRGDGEAFSTKIISFCTPLQQLRIEKGKAILGFLC